MKQLLLRELASCLLLAALAAQSPLADAAEPASECGLCYATVADGQRIVLPLESTEVQLDVQPGLLEAEVAQTFTNRTDTALEATYLYPLPAEATVTSFELRFRDRVVRSVVREKKQAKAEYEAAKAEGKKAALLEQLDPSLFSTAVANFLPGETVKVVIRFIQPVALSASACEIRFPMTTGVKYFPSSVIPGPKGVSAPTPPKVAASSAREHHYYAFDVLVSGFPAGTVASPSHAVRVEELAGGSRRVSLAEEITIPDRDFVLRLENRTGADTVSTVVVQPTASGAYGSFTVFPQQERSPSAVVHQGRDFLFLIDHSGSMEGTRIASAKLGLQGCLEMLEPNDRLQIEVFDDKYAFYKPEWIAATPAAVAAASVYCGRIAADGGTEMQPALEAALDFCSKEAGGREQVIVFLTDGDVGNETELMKLLERRIRRTRLFTFGIGGAPNAFLIGKMAELGRGQARFIADDGSIARELADLCATLATPVLTELRLSLVDAGGQAVPATIYPRRLGDVFMARPIQAVFVTEGTAPSAVLLQAQREGTPVEVRLSIGEMSSRGAGLEKLFGRMCYEDLSAQQRTVSGDAARSEALEKQKLQVALKCQLVTPQTSRVAIDSVVARDPRATLQSQTVAQYGAADQTVAAGATALAADEEIIVLSAFEVAASSNEGYCAATTLAGNRLRTDLRDVGSAVSVVTS